MNYVKQDNNLVMVMLVDVFFFQARRKPEPEAREFFLPFARFARRAKSETGQ